MKRKKARVTSSVLASNVRPNGFSFGADGFLDCDNLRDHPCGCRCQRGEGVKQPEPRVQSQPVCGEWYPMEEYDEEGDEVLFVDEDGNVGSGFCEWDVWFWNWDKSEFSPVAWTPMPAPPTKRP